MELPDLKDDPYLKLVRPLVEAYLAFWRADSRHIRSLRLTPSQFDVIATLGDSAGMTCAELSAKTLVTKGTLTGVLDRLTAKGLIRRDAVKSDRRYTTIRLTPKGEAAVRQVAVEAERREDRHAVSLAIRAFNTLIRDALNRHDSRAAFDVFYQYRQLASELSSDARFVKRIGGFFVVYANLAQELNCAFASDLAGFDLEHVVDALAARGEQVALERSRRTGKGFGFLRLQKADQFFQNAPVSGEINGEVLRPGVQARFVFGEAMLRKQNRNDLERTGQQSVNDLVSLGYENS